MDFVIRRKTGMAGGSVLGLTKSAWAIVLGELY